MNINVEKENLFQTNKQTNKQTKLTKANKTLSFRNVDLLFRLKLTHSFMFMFILLKGDNVH